MQSVDGLAPEDRVCLTGLDHVEAQRWSMARIEEYKSRIRALCLVYNAAAPINHHLPPEVLMRIFGYLNPGSYRQLKYLRVCRQWRDIMLHTPPFWADILSAVPLNMRDVKVWQSQYKRFEFFLNHSSPRPLDLTLRGCPAHVLEALTPHAHRLRSMTLSIEALDVEHLDRLLSVGMPVLEELSVVQLQRPERKVAECNELFATPIHLDPSKFPLLHTLHIPRSLFTTTNAVSSLQYLELTKCICTDCLYTRTQTFTPLLDALNQCPALETLRFEHSLPPHNNDPPPPDRVVSLPALRELHIDDHYPDTSKLLSHLDYPAKTSVTIEGVRFWRREGDNFKRALPPDLTRFHPIVDATEVGIEFGEITILETFAGDAQLLTYTITEFEARNKYDDDNVPMRYISELADMFTPASAITILSITVGMFVRADWVCLLRALPNLVSLDAEGSDGMYGLVPSLRRGPSAGSLLCPALEQLAFFWDYNTGLLCSKTDGVDKIRRVVGQMMLPPKDEDDSDNGSRVSYDSFGVPVFHHRRRDPWDYDSDSDDDENEQKYRDAEAVRMAGNWEPSQPHWEAEEWHSSYPALAFFSSIVGSMLKTRAEHGKALNSLSITVPEQAGGWFCARRLWEPEELQEKLAKRFGNLVPQLIITYDVS